MKYRNHTQRVMGVAGINEPTLTQGERLFLYTLAMFDVSGRGSHPGNKTLMSACGITTRQGVNKIAQKLIAKKLIEILEIGTGRGNATAYRICYSDLRFPPPKTATPELPFSDDKPATPEFPVQEQKPATHKPETRNWRPRNPQL